MLITFKALKKARQMIFITLLA